MLRSHIANLAHIRSVNAMDETLLRDGSKEQFSRRREVEMMAAQGRR